MPYERTPEIRDKMRQLAKGRTLSAETKAKIAASLKARHAKDKAQKLTEPLTAFPFEIIVIEPPIYIHFPPATPDPEAWVGFENDKTD